MKYVHLRGLGTPKVGRDAARAGNYREFEKIFVEHMKSEVAKADLTVAITHVKTHNTCLLCYERDYSKCHRSIVANRIVDATGYAIEHLSVPDAIEQPWPSKPGQNGQSSSLRRRPNQAHVTKKQFAAQA